MRKYKITYWYETKYDDCDEHEFISEAACIEDVIFIFKNDVRNYKRITKIEEIK
jgi:hypothetical protein